MSSLALRLPRASLDTTAWAFAVATKLLHELIEQPANLFLLALGAMLFRPPDLKIFPIDRVAFFVLIGAAAFRFCITRQRLHLHAASLPMLIMTALAFSNVVLHSYHAEAWSLFAAKWAVPVVLFHVAGSVFKDESSLRKLEIFSLAVLAYLIAISVFFLFD
jgi:hypothetical protein